MKINLQKAALLTVACILAVACTKDAKYDYLPKERVESKDLISTEENYIYQLANLEATRTSPFARPFFVAETKLVRLRFTENSLQVVQVDPETKFDANSTNQKPVIEIPIEHIAYRCKEDKTGECTNSEELDEHTSWNDRPSFKPNFNDIKTTELAALTPEIATVVGCAEETGQRFVSYKIEEDAINIVVEKNFKMNIFCAGGISSLSDLSYSALYHYSLVKESKVASPGYTPIKYPRSDESTFGFFTTEYVRLDVDNSDTVKSEVILMNRWNPNRKTISYLLSDNLYKAENKKVLEATLEGVKRVNSALAKAGTQLEIVTEKQEGRNLGDLRNSSIIVVEDPLEFRVIGYGPSVANPTTGEILSGRTVMYLGTIKTLIRRSYEEIWEAQQTTQTAQRSSSRNNIIKKTLENKDLELLSTHIHEDGSVKKQNKKQKNKDNKAPVLKVKRPTAVAHHGSFNSSLKKAFNSQALKKAATQIASGREHSRSMNALFLELQNMNEQGNLKAMKEIEKKIADLASSKHCFLDGSNMDLNDSLVEAIKSVVGDQMVAWDELKEQQKQDIVDLVLPVIWIPTLVHEIGHNLGLRHNFAGSRDSENFYTAEELSAEGLNRPITYSSVMDYSYNTVNELPIMGKYDIAALRFGYTRQVEVVKDNEVQLLEVPVQSSIEKAVATNKVSLKNYGFCTDEHTVINPNCNRFDEGSSFTEIAQHHIRSYEEGYKRNNFRNNKRNFSIYGDAAYANRINSTFFALRSMIEMKERLSTRFGITEADFQKCPANKYGEGSCEFISDIQNAAVLAANFLTQVIATPNVVCLVGVDQNKDGEVDVVNDRPLLQLLGLSMLRSALGSEALSCFDPELRNILANGLTQGAFLVLAEGGKHISSLKSATNENPYVDQIDVRGIWIDKILAMRYLVLRETGYSVFDGETHNFYNYASTRKIVADTIAGTLLDQVQTPVEFRFLDGSKTDINVSVSLYEDHKVGLKVAGLLDDDLHLPNVGSELHLNHAFIANVRAHAPSTTHYIEGKQLAELVRVYNDTSTINTSTPGLVSLDILGRRFVALPQNVVAQQSIITLLKYELMSAVKPERLQVIAKAKATEGAPKPADLDEAETSVWNNVTLEDLNRYLSNEIDTEFYINLLTSLQ